MKKIDTWHLQRGVMFVVSKHGFTVLGFFSFQKSFETLGSELDTVLLCCLYMIALQGLFGRVFE